MLTDDEKERMVEEEMLRASVRKSVEDQGKESNPFLRTFKSDNFRWIITTLAIPLTVFIWSEHAKWKDDRERLDQQKSENAQHNIDLVIKLLPMMSKQIGDPERYNALVVIKTLEDESNLPKTLRAAIEGTATDLRQDVSPDGTIGNPGAIKETEVLASSNPSSADIASNQTAPSTIVVPGAKVFIQIFYEAQHEEAAKLQTIARSIGVAAPGIEDVISTAIKQNRKPPKGYNTAVLLVFRKGDMEIAEKLKQAVKEKGDLDLAIRDRSGIQAFKNVPAGQLEIWFPDPLSQRDS